MSNVIGILDYKPQKAMKASVKRLDPKKRKRLLEDLTK